MSISSLNDLRPGDIMISGQSTAPASFLVYGGQLLLQEQFRIGRFVAGHAAVVTPNRKLVEAMPHGARERDLVLSDWSPGRAYFRLPEDYPGQHLDAAAVAQAMIGTPYSIASYAYLAMYIGGFRPAWLAKRIDRRISNTRFALPTRPRVSTENLPAEAICSVLADQAWTLTGKTVVHDTRSQIVTPGMLTQELWTEAGVIRGGVGIA